MTIGEFVYNIRNEKSWLINFNKFLAEKQLEETQRIRGNLEGIEEDVDPDPANDSANKALRGTVKVNPGDAYTKLKDLVTNFELKYGSTTG